MRLMRTNIVSGRSRTGNRSSHPALLCRAHLALYLLAVCCAVLLTRTLTHSSFTQVYNGHLTVRLLLIPWWLIFVLLAMFWDQPLWYINGPLVIALELLVLIVSLILSATLD